MKNSTTRPGSPTALIELLIACFLWGFGFVATVWALQSLGPLTITAIRFIGASVVGYLFLFFKKKWGGEPFEIDRGQLSMAIVPGLLISLTLIIQTFGQKYTTATKSSFITILYVLFVPLLQRYWLKQHLSRKHFVFVGIGLVGVALMCDLQALLTAGATSINIGDMLTLITAVVASVHIIWLGILHQKIESPFEFNLHQCAIAGIIPLAFALLLEPWPSRSAISTLALTGLVCLTLGSSLIAFYLQVKAQKVIGPSTASLLFLLESPIALAFAMYLLGETLGVWQAMGAVLILFSTILAARQVEPSEGSGLQQPAES